LYNQISYSTAPLHKIKRIEFGLLNPKEIEEMSVCEVKHPIAYEYGKIKENGLNDLRMGTMDRMATCLSCNGRTDTCPGHFGHIKLSQPVFHYGFLNTIRDILKCICFNCSRLLTDKNDLRTRNACRIKDPKKRFKEIVKICDKINVCESSRTVY